VHRWERAYKFGLAPPPEVRQIILRQGEDSAANHDLWSGRV
jgi:hypothetical protein